MHKWLLLIVPATDREEAINEAERFMDANTGIEVFDHYSLWGRRANHVPDITEDYWVVVVDMHN